MNAIRANSFAALAAGVVLGLSGSFGAASVAYADAGHNHEKSGAVRNDQKTDHQPMASMMSMPMMNP